MSNQPPLFNSGLELANLVVSSGLVNQSWDSILQLYCELNQNEQIRVRAYKKPDCTVIAFVSSPTFVKHHLHKELMFSSSLSYLLCTKSNSSFAIHKAAVILFDSLLDQLRNLKTLISDSVPLIVTGHSVGGSVAVLFTLWLLESTNPRDKKDLLCITFGAPLIGDKGLQEAISRSLKWNSYFLHIAANQDLVPRLFVSPHDPNAMEVDSRTVAYQPFGTYLLCSECGYTCIDDPEEVSEMLVAMCSETMGNQNPNGELPIFCYTEIVKNFKSILFKGILLAEPKVGPLRARILLQLEAVGVKRTLPNSDFNVLIARMEKREKLHALNNRKSFDPNKKLNDMKVYMAYLEWYKKVSKSQNKGYYDNYKNKKFPMDVDVIKFKKKLNQYWEKVVEEAEKMPHRMNAPLKTTWLYAGINYRRMVEPLDIADYYNKGLKDYEAYRRSSHYMKLEKWLKADTPKSRPLDKKKKNVSEILTKDSCFWAHVEEALMLCKSLREGKEERLTREKLFDFEEYVMQEINKYAVSPEIFLEGSSFMQWWREYKVLIGTIYESELTGFMKNGGCNKYADGSF